MNKTFLETEQQNNLGRYEIKMVYDGNQSGYVKSLIQGHSLMFREAYPPRQVNNIYFDTTDFQLQDAHIQGSFQRFKIRLRWYNPTWVINDGVLELKLKTGRLGRKEVFPIPVELDLQKQSWIKVLSLIDSSLDNELLNVFKSTIPVLINSYQREYYQSADRLLRITLDKNLQSLDQRFGPSPNLSYIMPTRNNIILEVKADGTYHKEVANALEEFPTYCSAYSKYIQGTATMSY